MAPDSRLVDIKVGDHSGAADVTQMIAAIDWVIANRYSNGLNIRIINLSYGNQSNLDQASDPVSWAAESAWKAGIVVVASSGNDGANVGLASPGFNNWIITVGAADTKGTQSFTDDTIPSFSQVGTGVTRGPDVLAPGVGIVSLGVNGSALRNSYPSAAIGNGFMRGSGTSQAAAVVSGAAALLLQQYPWMTPDDVKGHLARTATKLKTVTSQVQGSGELNLSAALTTVAVKSSQSSAVGNGRGSLDASRGGSYVQMDGAKLAGEKDVMGSAWNSAQMAAGAGSRTAWKTGGVFNGATWVGDGGLAVDTSTWSGSWYEAWSGRTWSGPVWSGRTWSGRTWSGRTWSGRVWTGADWSSAAWTGAGWSSAAWQSPVEAPAWAGRVWTSGDWS
jgi:serine protease AprX